MKPGTGFKSAAFVRSERKEASAVKKIRAKKCAVRECRNPFEPRSTWAQACSPECAAIVAQQKREADDRRADKVKRESLKTRSDHMKEAQLWFNTFVRARDLLAGRACISSGVPLEAEAMGGGFDAGHYRSVGSAPHLRFDERNCHGQSKHDNRYLGGNAVAYRRGLIERIGLAEVDSLEADDTPRKYSIADLKGITAHYKAKVRELRK